MLRGIIAGHAGFVRRSPLVQVLPLLAAFVPGLPVALRGGGGYRLGSGLSGSSGGGGGGHRLSSGLSGGALPPPQSALPGKAASAAAAGASQAFLSERRWAEVQAQLSPPLYRALREAFKFERLAKVQDATLELLLRGEDVFSKAKTGGGKTLGFLVPALDRLLRAGGGGGGGGGGGRIGVLVISPTRELALQILAEARTLATFAPALRVDCCIGGTSITSERERFSRGGHPVLDVLVATPGRCADHIKTSPGFKAALAGVRVLVLDEADRLLDMGFERDISFIQSHLPPPAPPPAPGAPRAAGRQTMLFSATVPEGVKSVAHRLLRAGYPMVDTVGKEDAATNTQVTQEVMVRGALPPRRWLAPFFPLAPSAHRLTLPFLPLFPLSPPPPSLPAQVLPQASVLPALARVLAHTAGSNPQHKTIVFYATARLAGYFARLFERLALPNPRAPAGAPPLRLGVVEMHSRLSQGQRAAAADRFRAGSGLVMFSSDVSARGMDYPGVTEVIQVGMTDRESYIHRLGRTARAGRGGGGLLLLSNYEARALLPELAGLPINPAGPASSLTGGARSGLPGYVPPAGVAAAAAGGGGGGGGGGGRRGPAAAAFVEKCGQCAPVANPPCVSALLTTIGREPEMLKAATQAYGASLGHYNG